jgi:hypothetical protein
MRNIRRVGDSNESKHEHHGPRQGNAPDTESVSGTICRRVVQIEGRTMFLPLTWIKAARFNSVHTRRRPKEGEAGGRGGLDRTKIAPRYLRGFGPGRFARQHGAYFFKVAM